MIYVDGYHDNRFLSQTRIAKTGKQAISRKTTTKNIKTEFLGQKTNFPSLVMGVYALSWQPNV